MKSLTLAAAAAAASLASTFAFSIAAAETDENSDLDFIPRTVSEKPETSEEPPAHSRLQGKYLVEEALTAWARRTNLRLPTSTPNWQSLASAEARIETRIGSSARLNFSDRFSVVHQDDRTFPDRDSFRNDLREFFASSRFNDSVFFEIGRVNTRSGVALGYNPTDFFRTRSAVSQASIDPSATRENRLGVVQARAQVIFPKASFAFHAAPDLAPAAGLASSEPSLSLRLGQTNNQNRFLASLSTEILDLSPQALVFHDDQGERFGFNLSRSIGRSLVLYGEWTGGRMPTLVSRALDFGQKTGALPAISVDHNAEFQNDVSLGGSWTTSSKLSVNLEYHYHQSGLSKDDLDRWLTNSATSASLRDLFWYVRQYAAEEQEPLTRNQIFLRMSLPDVFVGRHELSAVAFVNPEDGSTTTQLASAYPFDDAWSMEFFWTSFWGNAMTEKGSLPFENAVTAKLSRYF